MKRISQVVQTSSRSRVVAAMKMASNLQGCCNSTWVSSVEQCVFHMDESYVMDADRDVDFVDLDASWNGELLGEPE